MALDISIIQVTQLSGPTGTLDPEGAKNSKSESLNEDQTPEERRSGQGKPFNMGCFCSKTKSIYKLEGHWNFGRGKA